MKRFAAILKWFVGLLFIVMLVVIGCFVSVSAIERDSAEKTYLYNYAFVAEKDEDGLHMWFVKNTTPDELKTGDGVIYYTKEGCRRANYCEGVGFCCSDELSEPAPVTSGNFVGKIVAVW